MDPMAEQALAALEAAVISLLPATVPGGLNRDVVVAPVRISPAGMGGFIGTHPEPRGSIWGRRVEASVRVAIRGGQEAAAASYLAQVLRSVLAQGRADLLRLGIQRLRAEVEDARHAAIALLFEYQRLPQSGEGVIASLDLALEQNPTRYRTRFAFDVAARGLAALSEPLQDFAVADDPDLNAGSPASQWLFNPAELRIEQNAAVRGGPLALTQPKKAGAQLLWRPAGESLDVERFIAGVEFESASEDGIGLVFARQDAQNFFYFLASRRHRYHLLGRKQAGVYNVVGSPNTDAGFELDRRSRLRVFACDGEIEVELDGVRTLSARVDALPSGAVGFLTHGNNRARFHRATLIELY